MSLAVSAAFWMTVVKVVVNRSMEERSVSVSWRGFRLRRMVA